MNINKTRNRNYGPFCKRLWLPLCSLFLFCLNASSQPLPDRNEVLKTMQKVNSYFMQKYPDFRQPLFAKGRLWSNAIWTHTVYFEGLLSLYSIYPSEEYYNYMKGWADFNEWGYWRGTTTRHADNYSAGQVYIDLYRLAPEPEKLRKVRANATMLASIPQNDDWWWIDAVQMGMPLLAKMGTLTGDRKYYDKMWQLYESTRNRQGTHGFFNEKDGLWWRDKSFIPPYKEPNGKNCYWSRGNGWVYVALTRVLDELPVSEEHYKDYIKDFQTMSRAIKECQRTDGFWNVSLHDPSHFGGRETTGTSLFVAGLAWGIRQGLLERKDYLPVVVKAWNAMVREAVHPNGFLGYVQGTGKEPKDGQPVTYDSMPDFEDFGTGCFLLAGTGVYKLK